MPALPVIADVYRCALHWTDGAGQDAVNVIHIKGPTSGDAASVMDALDDTVANPMWPSVSDQAHVDDVAITPLDGVTATSHFAPATPANFTGQSGGTEYEPQISAIVKLTTAFRGRSKRGRVYLPFTDESVVSKGFLVSPIPADLTTAWTNFGAALNSLPDGPFAMVVASYKLATYENIASFLGEAVAGTQRRRQGRNRGA